MEYVRVSRSLLMSYKNTQSDVGLNRFEFCSSNLEILRTTLREGKPLLWHEHSNTPTRRTYTSATWLRTPDHSCDGENSVHLIDDWKQFSREMLPPFKENIQWAAKRDEHTSIDHLLLHQRDRCYTRMSWSDTHIMERTARPGQPESIHHPNHLSI